MKAEVLTRKRGMGYKFTHERLLTQVETEIMRINLPDYSMSYSHNPRNENFRKE